MADVKDVWDAIRLEFILSAGQDPEKVNNELVDALIGLAIEDTLKHGAEISKEVLDFIREK